MHCICTRQSFIGISSISAPYHVFIMEYVCWRCVTDCIVQLIPCFIITIWLCMECVTDVGDVLLIVLFNSSHVLSLQHDCACTFIWICISQVRPMAHMQLQVEKQSRKKSPLSEIVRSSHWFMIVLWYISYIWIWQTVYSGVIFNIQHTQLIYFYIWQTVYTVDILLFMTDRIHRCYI